MPVQGRWRSDRQKGLEDSGIHELLEDRNEVNTLETVVGDEMLRTKEGIHVSVHALLDLTVEGMDKSSGREDAQSLRGQGS